MIDANPQAARAFYKKVSYFASHTKGFEVGVFYDTKPDEIWDLTLISRRIYGNSHETLAIMAAAGIDSIDEFFPFQVRP